MVNNIDLQQRQFLWTFEQDVLFMDFRGRLSLSVKFIISAKIPREVARKFW